MESIHAPFSASIAELKNRPSALIREAEGSPVAILSHNQPIAYLIPAETYEALLDQIEDLDLAHVVLERRHENPVSADLESL